MERPKSFVICTRKTVDYEIFKELKKSLNVRCLPFNYFEDFLQYITDNLDDIDVVGIDTYRLVETFKNQPAGMLDLLKEIGLTDKVKKIVLANTNDDLNFLQDCLSVGFDSLGPAGCYFDVDEKVHAMKQILNGKKYIPTKIQQKMQSSKQRHLPNKSKIRKVLVLQNRLLERNMDQSKWLEKNLNMKIEWVQSINELIKYINTSTDPIHAVLLEIGSDVYNNLDFFDVFSSIQTILQLNENTKNTIIGGVVGTGTDLKTLKKVQALIKSFGLRGPEYSLEDKYNSLSAVMQNKPYLHPSFVEKINSKKLKTSGIKLTPRQEQVVELIANRGASNKVIGRILKISESTVKLHLSAIFKKYGVTNRTQLSLCYKDNIHKTEV